MATLYTNGDYTALSPTQFNSYSLIRYSVDQPDQSVSLGLTVSGTVNFSTKLGTVSALVDGFTGSDNIVTGAGNDTIWGNSGSDVLSGGIGDDLLIGDWDTADRVGNDTLYGGDGDDELIGGPGSDAQYGGNGDDVFSIGEAAASVDSIFGGSGVDAVSIRDVFSVYVPTMSFSRLAFAEANSIEYLLWDNPGIAITGTTGSNLFDFSNLTVLCWNGSSYEDRFEVDLLAGNDTFLGGSGDEHVTTSGAGDRITLGDGDDRLTVLDGTLAGSTISAGAGHDTLDLGSLTGFDLPVKSLALSVLTSAVAMGFESIKIGQNVQLSGTAQADVFDFAPLDFNMMAYDLPILLLGGNDKVFGAAGDFRADGGTGNDTLTSEGGNDRLWGGDGNDVLSGGAGNDQLYGGLGADRLVGGEGGDIYQVDSLDDVIVETGLSGTDSVIFLRATYRLPTSIEDMFVGRASGGRAIGNAGGNQIFDGAGKDSLYGLGGNDTLTSNDNRDTLDGGRGDDVYDVRGNATAHIVERGGEGTDTVWTYLETYTLPDFVENMMGKHFDRGQVLTGNALGNYITGMSGRNHFFGLGGNDTLDGGAGADTLEGGAGSDVYLVDNAQDKVIDSDSNGLVLSSADSYTLSSGVNRLELTGAARFGIGNTASNLMTASDIGGSLSGVGGNDDLRGGAAADNLYGGSGNDTLNGGAGNDYMVGGDDDDVYLADSVNDMLFEEAHGGIDTLIITAARVVLRDNIEILKNDYSGGTVNSAGSEVYGNAWGDDFATVGDNRITTGIGRDSLFGAGGNDTLTGGRGDDLFGAELNYFYRPFVTITDFQAGSDRIALHSGYFGPLETAAISALSEAEFKVLGKGQNLDADDRILYNPLTGVLWYDEDGSGSLAAIKFALLETHAVLTAADFVMIGMD